MQIDTPTLAARRIGGVDKLSWTEKFFARSSGSALQDVPGCDAARCRKSHLPTTIRLMYGVVPRLWQAVHFLLNYWSWIMGKDAEVKELLLSASWRGNLLLVVFFWVELILKAEWCTNPFTIFPIWFKLRIKKVLPKFHYDQENRITIFFFCGKCDTIDH